MSKRKRVRLDAAVLAIASVIRVLRKVKPSHRQWVCERALAHPSLANKEARRGK